MSHWIDDAAAGATLIAPSDRIAREMRIGYANAQAASADYWPAPDIVAFRRWTLNCWELCLPSEQLLNVAQELALFRYALDAEPEAGDLISPMSLARTMRHTDHLVTTHQITLPEPDIASSAEYGLFHAVRARVDALLTQRGFMMADRVAQALVARLADGTWTPSATIRFVGFTSLNGQQRAMLDALQVAGVDARADLRRPAAPASAPYKTTYASAAGELHAVAEHARALIEAQGGDDPRIGVLVPDVAQWRPIVERVFSSFLVPDDAAAGQGGSAMPRPWAYSMGLPLAELPAIGAALDLLQLTPRDNDASRLSRILLSLSFWDTGSVTDRAQIDYALRKTGGTRHSVAWLGTLADGQSIADSTKDQMAALRQAIDGAPAKALPSRWAEHFDGLLDTCGWVVRQERCSQDYQLHEVWQTVMRELSAMDHQLGEIVHGQAWVWLNELMIGRDFNPRTNALPAIRVYSHADAPYLNFTHTFVLGLTDSVLPAPVQRNAFLDERLLSDADVPQATPEDCLAEGRALAAWIQGCGDQVHLSCHTHGERGELVTPSTLLAPWPQVSQTDDVPTGRDLALVTPEADPIPGVSEDEATGVRGGVSILAWQAQVPYVAFMQSRLGFKPMPEAGASLSPATQGTFVHRVLERIWRELGNQSALLAIDDDALSQFVAGHAYEAGEIEGLVAGRVYGPALASLERRRVTGLCTSWLRHEKQRVHPFEVVACEKEVQVEIAGLPITLKIDRIDRIDVAGTPRTVLIDYKTGNRISAAGWNPDQLTDPQLPLYATAPDLDDLGRCEGIALAHVAARGQGFNLYASFADQLVDDKRRATGRQIANWADQLAAWSKALDDNAAAFMAGDAHVLPDMLRNPRGYEDIARLMTQSE